ncbi:chloride intracellular channel protein 5 [Gracilinanus agilis]|uniref:chloride intracellular channel protein 5 n=1 Tax=Gracilinanus agilis TaxID=191870 RepID=UPI001CFE723D|nr:chloride intracellular channel protein 5 [Gracilinanus agilis]
MAITAEAVPFPQLPDSHSHCFRTVHRKPADLHNLAPGTHPPFLTFNGDVKTDVNKIEEFLEETLTPQKYPKLAAKHRESNTAGIDIFSKFSAYIKNTKKQDNACDILGSKVSLSTGIVAKKYRNYEIPAEMTGLWRYLKNAYARDEFTNTCAADSEIEMAYADVAKRLSIS